MSLTEAQIKQLAPDDASFKAGQQLANAAKWVTKSAHERALWGDCQGSGKVPYATLIDLQSLSFKCSCPSRKFPCKHGLGLLLLHAKAANTFAQPTELADHVAEWIDKRDARQTAKETKADKPVDEKAQQKRAEQRNQKVEQGVEELTLWLKDNIRTGLMDVPQQAYQFTPKITARMVDAQAPGLAAALRDMGALNYFEDGWQPQLLRRMAHTYMLLSAFQKMPQLDEPLQQEVRALVGWTTAQEKVLEQTGISDQWLVMAASTEEVDKLRVDKTWLYGQTCRQFALLLQFTPMNAPVARVPFVQGMVFEGEVVYYPALWPLRALVKSQQMVAATTAPQGHPDLETILDALANALKTNPLLSEIPFLVNNISIQTDTKGHWQVTDATGHSLPIANPAKECWPKMAQSLGRPIVATLLYRFGQMVLAGIREEENPKEPSILGTTSPSAGAVVRKASVRPELVTTALLGTEKSNPDYPPLGNSDLAARIAARASDREDIFLRQTAAAFAFSDAGMAAAPTMVQNQVFKGETGAFLPEKYNATLEVALDSNEALDTLIVRYMAFKAVRDGHSVPTRLVPAMLNRALQLPKGRRETLIESCGPVGQWLMGLHPDWAALASVGEEVEFETASFEARKKYISELRKTDPDEARALIENSLKQEHADQRTELLQLLAPELSIADLPLLESLLADKSKKVREVVLMLLAQIPTSSVVALLLEHWKNAVRVREKRTMLVMSNKVIEWEKPAQPNPELFRLLGFEKISSEKGIDDHVYHAVQALAFLSPDQMAEAVGCTATELLQMLLKLTHQRFLQPYFVQSALLHGHPEWCEILVEHQPRIDLVAVLPPERHDALLIKMVPEMNHVVLFALLTDAFVPIAPDLGKALLNGLEKSPYDLDKKGYFQLGLQLDPSLWTVVQKMGNPEHSDNTKAQFGRFLLETMRGMELAKT
jgi:hypothetical protein